ncbi:hypothetical protein [Streptomyces sp. NPDC047043]|uniref:hypothetical protein n=1 Tax=Streptomyces sp. NPDC047043 TaxID=3154497 RepID=UPI0033ED7A50
MRGRKGKVRELAALMGVLAATLALMVWGASSASAGGPTSVLVTSPSSGEASALYYSDGEYAQLQRLLGPPGTGTREKPPGPDLAGARQINVTWLAHDISPWRMDRVFPVDSRTGAVWIHTAANVPDNLDGYWHRAGNPAQLRTLLKKLGVMGKASDDGYVGIFPAPWQSEGTDAAATPDAETKKVTAGSSAAGTDDGTDWWWALPGAGAGALLALVLRPFASREPLVRWHRGREPGARQELRDV